MIKALSDEKHALDHLKQVIVSQVFTPSERALIAGRNGNEMRWLFNFRNILLSGETLDIVCELLWQRLERELPFQVGGLETLAIALVSGMVMKAKERGALINGFYIRKSRKKDGLQRIIEGELAPEKIILVDDILNSGKSMIRQIEVLKAEGRTVYAVCAILRFREPAFYAFFEEQGIKVITLLSLEDLSAQVGRDLTLHAKQATPPITMPFEPVWHFASHQPNLFYVLPKSAPAIDAKRVYFGSDDGTLWALNQGDGSVAWQFSTLFGSKQKRIFSAPALLLDLLYFGAYDGNVYALDTETGKKRWVYKDADWIGSSPAVASDLGLVFIGLEFGLWKKQGGIAALDAHTGEKKWWYHVEGYVHGSPGYSSKEKIVACGSNDGHMYAWDARSGKLLWKYKTDGEIKASVAFDDERGLITFGSFDRHIYVLRTRTGELVHKIETLEALYSTPLVHKGSVYMSSLDKCIYAIDLDSGALRWQFWTSGRVFASPEMIDGRLYVGSNDGRLYEIDPTTGKELGFFQATERIVNKIAHNPTTKRFFVPTHANELYCLVRDSATA